MIAALLPLALQVADPQIFAPPLDRAFTVAIEQVRTVGKVRGTYRSTRQVRFRREGGELVAELTIDRPKKDPASDELFERAIAALAGETIRFRLGRDGRVTAIDALDRHWDRLCATIAAIPPTGERFAAPLRAFPPAARLRFLGTMLDPILPAPDRHPPGQRPVSVEARAPTGAAIRLEGRERVARRGDGTLQVTVDAEGDDGKAAITLSRRDVLDPVTGLRVSHDERRRTALLGEREAGALTVEDRWTVTPR